MLCYILFAVMGGANYTTRAPPKSYINVLDFENPKQLAEFLIQLANDEEEYQSYFWWKVQVANTKMFIFIFDCLRNTMKFTIMKEKGQNSPCANSVKNYMKIKFR